MPPTFVLVYAEAYERKGGGYRAVAKNNRTGEVKRGEVHADWDAARNEAIRFARELCGDTVVAPGYYRNRRGSWRCNYWAIP